jgi:triacylglycerol lipase
MSNTIVTKPCWPKCTITIIIVILIILLLGILLFNYFINRARQNFSKKYKISIVQYCNDLPNVNYTQTVIKPKNPGIYEFTLSKALLETSLLVTQSNCINIVPMRNPPGFMQQYRMVGINPYDNKNRMISTVFTNTDGSGKLLMVFTGTFFMDEWFNDINFPQVEAVALNNYKPGILVHTGFYNLYMVIRDQLWNLFKQNQNKVNDFYITGHSLGGALSIIAAFDFARYHPIHYSFASPRVGNVDFAKRFNELLPQSLRIYNVDDIVPELPPPVIFGNIYQHVNKGIPFDVNLGTLDKNHVTAYLDYLPLCIPNIAPCPT